MHTFDKQSAHRIAKVVREVENEIKFEEQEQQIYQQAQMQVYYAKVPTGGIPGRNSTTGELGSADCELYSSPLDINDKRHLTAMLDDNDDPIIIEVFNINLASINSDYIKIIKHKDGTWVALVGVGGATLIAFRILSIAPFVGETAACEAVLAEVLRINCSGSAISVGDEVIIYDPSGCYFNIPIQVLINAHGTALLTAWDDDINSHGIAECFVNSYDYGAEGECYWAVQTLSCCEDIYDYTP